MKQAFVFSTRFLAIFILTGVFQFSAAGDPVVEYLQAREKPIVEAFRKSMECKSVEKLVEGNLYCKARFRGLEVEFASANAPGGGSIYIGAIGKNQQVTNLGRRCLLVIFNDPDLADGASGVQIILRNDSVISGNAANQKARAACE